VRKGWNGRKSLRRLKPTVGCNASKKRRISKPKRKHFELLTAVVLQTRLPLTSALFYENV